MATYRLKSEDLYCTICDEYFDTIIDLESHMAQHSAVEKMPEDDSNFIPEITRDDNGRVKPRPYHQGKWQPTADEWGG